MGEHGWPFAVSDDFPGAGDDPVLGAKHLKDIYLKVSPDYEGRYVVLIHVFGFWSVWCTYRSPLPPIAGGKYR